MIKKIRILLICIAMLVSCSPDDKPVSEKADYNLCKITYGGVNRATLDVFNSKGYYYLSDILASQTGEEFRNIVFYDFAAEKAFFLCNDLGCDHKHEGCTSYVPVMGKLFVNEDSLFYINHVRDSNGDMTEELYLMDTDGQNRKLIYRHVNEDLYDYDHVIIGEDKIYTCLEDEGKFYLCEIDLNTGDTVHLKEVDHFNDLIVTAYGSKIVFMHIEPYDRSVYLGPTQKSLMSYDVTDGKTEVVYTYDAVRFEDIAYGESTMKNPVSGTVSWFKDNMVYLLNTDDNKVIECNLISGEEEELLDVSALSFAQGYNIEYVYENYILLSYQGEEIFPPNYVIVDVNTGDYNICLLERYNQRYHRNEKIYFKCYSEDKRIFEHEGGDYIIKRYLPDGTIEEDVLPCYGLAYITLEDMFNGESIYHSMTLEDK